MNSSYSFPYSPRSFVFAFVLYCPCFVSAFCNLLTLLAIEADYRNSLINLSQLLAVAAEDSIKVNKTL